MTSDREFIPSAIAATASGSFSDPANADEANSSFTKFLSRVALGCVAAGSTMIGHIKANVRSGDELLSMSCTTDDGNVRLRYKFSKTVAKYTMTVNVIVYGIDKRRTAEILVSNLRSLGVAGLEVHSEVGCEDPSCDDPLCQRDEHVRVINIE